MDWGLVLASQDIGAIIGRTEEGWQLVVDEGDYEAAVSAINQYQAENRGWRWKHKLPGPGVFFHWASAGWAVGMGLIYYWAEVLHPGLRGRGIMDNELVRGGQWWRVITAVTLHEDLAHLAANVTTGFALLGLAMGRYGPGVAVLAALAAGAIGNCADLAAYPTHRMSLGASGMVMGALGLLAVQSVSLWRKFRPARTFVLRSAAGAVLLLVLLGFAENSDVTAHVGGFAGGAVVGLILGKVRPEVLQRPAPNMLAGTAAVMVVVGAWAAAVR
jgi:membrane associated rhomboid family serine protease